MRRRVFITHYVDWHDYAKLAEIGPLVPVFTKSIFPDDVIGSQPRYWALTDEAMARLASFDRSCDVLALAGDPVAIAICTAYVARTRLAPFTVAKFDRQAGGYYLVEIGGPYGKETAHQGSQV